MNKLIAGILALIAIVSLANNQMLADIRCNTCTTDIRCETYCKGQP